MSKIKQETTTITHINSDNLKYERNFALAQIKFHLFAPHSRIIPNMLFLEKCLSLSLLQSQPESRITVCWLLLVTVIQ